MAGIRDYLMALALLIPTGSFAEPQMHVPAGEANDLDHAGGAQESAASTPSFVSIVHPGRGHVMRRVSVRGLTHHTAVSPDGKYGIAVHSGAGGISVIDLESMSVIKEIQTGRAPNFALFSSDGRGLYVSNAFSGTLSEIDTGN